MHSSLGTSNRASKLIQAIKGIPVLQRSLLGIIGLLAALLAAIVFSSSVGPVPIPFERTTAILLEKLHLAALTGSVSSISDRELLVVWQIRFPRVLVGALVGAALGVSGAAMQGVFRNPLVEPGYIGVSSGAAAGAVCALFFGWAGVSRWALPLSAFIGAALAVLTIVSVWRSSRSRSIATLLLLGIGINALLSAMISVLVASSNNEQELRSIVFWLQGGLEARTWDHVRLIGLPIIAACLLTISFGRHLNMLMLGDDQAASCGVNVRRTRYALLALASLMTGSAVAVSGIIGFVGLLVPHLIRLLAGPDHRFLLPASALGGALFLVLADVVSRMVLQPVTLQVGVVCACIGAPLFIGLILRSHR